MLKYAQEEFPALEDLKVIHFVRKKPWYDIRQQFENHKTGTLFDLPEDYEPLNKYWITVNAFLNLRFSNFTVTDKGLHTHCVDMYQVKPDSPKKQFCVKVWPHFCPFGFTTRCQPRKSELPEDISVATQLSFDRFWRLEEMAKEWEGPISAAIWFEESDWPRVISTILLSKLPMDRVSIHLVSQKGRSLFPINVLRNVAVNHTVTDMVLSLDVDFMTSPLLHRKLTESRRYRSIWETSHQRHAFIVPAFEFTQPQRCIRLAQLQKVFNPNDASASCFEMPTKRSTMVEHLINGTAVPFHPNGKGHLATNNDRWMRETRLYYIHWMPWYEPYIIARKSQIDFPWFHEQFYGRLG